MAETIRIDGRECAIMKEQFPVCAKHKTRCVGIYEAGYSRQHCPGCAREYKAKRFFAAQVEDLKNQCFQQGIPDDAEKILNFCAKKEIRRLSNICGFVTAWRLNPVRQSILLNERAAKTEEVHLKIKQQYARALHTFILDFEQKAGYSAGELLKSIPKAKNAAAEKEQRRQKIMRQLRDK